MNTQAICASSVNLGHIYDDSVSNLMDWTATTNLFYRQNQPANLAHERPTPEPFIVGELNIKTTPTSGEDKD
jgi:hypothetical protein